MPSYNIKFSKNQIEQFCEGVINSEWLAEQFGCNRATIRYHLKKIKDPRVSEAMNDPHKNGNFRDNKKRRTAETFFAAGTGSNKDISERLNIPSNTIREWRLQWERKTGAEREPYERRKFGELPSIMRQLITSRRPMHLG